MNIQNKSFDTLDLVNNSFCPLPFIHISTLPSGKTRLCCKAVNNYIPNGNLNDTPLQEIWNSEYYTTVRKQMLIGEYPEACKVCYDEDAVGKRSMRVKEIEIWNKSTALQSALSAENNGVLKTNPVYLDLRMGNLCNLKCRTCDPVSSSQIHREGSLLKDSPVFFRQKMTDADQMKPWWKTQKFKNSLKDLLPATELIWLSGGEPTLVPEGNALMQDCIDKGYAQNITIRLVVNLTNISDDFVNRYEQFREANFHCSIDAIGAANDYLRYPSKFEVVENNLRRIVNSKSNLVCMICTVSLMNISRLPEIIDWLDLFNKSASNKVRLNINPLNKPDIFHPAILDEETKKDITEKLLSFKTNEKNTSEIQSLIKIMNRYTADLNQLRKDFRKYIDSVDFIRSQKFTEVFPELVRFYEICND